MIRSIACVRANNLVRHTLRSRIRTFVFAAQPNRNMRLAHQAKNGDGLAFLHRALVFAPAASDAQQRLHLWQVKIFAVGNCLDCLGRAMVDAESAVDSLCLNNTAAGIEPCQSDACSPLVGNTQLAQSTAWTDLATACAIVIAVGCSIVHLWLQQAAQAIVQR